MRRSNIIRAPCSSPAVARVFVALMLATLLAACLSRGRPYTFHGTPYEPPQRAHEIEGIDQRGQPFRLSDRASLRPGPPSEGRVVLLFFGYTFCPDVCPTTLSEMQRVYRMLGDDAADVDIVFVSVDPRRDTPARLAAFLSAFDVPVIGVQVDETRLPEILAAYGAWAEIQPIEGGQSAGGYLVDQHGVDVPDRSQRRSVRPVRVRHAGQGDRSGRQASAA